MADAPQAYILCSNPRSGTTLLCDMLSQTRVAGKPNSFFRQRSLQDWCDDWGIQVKPDTTNHAFSRQYFDAMRREGEDGTGVFGLRLMGPDLDFARQWLARAHPEPTTDHGRFSAAFGPLRYIHLSRQDKLAEAVSYLRAEQTGLWHSHPDGSDLERIAPTAPEGYDADALTKRMTELATFDAAWDAWFEAEGIRPLRLTYEALAQEPRETLALVLRYIGQDPNLAQRVTPGVRKLADATSAAWIRRYRATFPNT